MTLFGVFQQIEANEEEEVLTTKNKENSNQNKSK